MDDVEENVEVLYSILEIQNYRIAIALNAEQTYLAVEREIPDLILLDVMLPDGNGFEVAAELLKKYQNNNIPIIFVTALAHLRDRIEGFRVGGVDYISKPYEELEVLARVKTHVELGRIRKEQEQLIVELKETLSEVSSLRGLIPICTNCKNIRDDKGYWIQVEKYMSEHSEAEFTHSICPSCVDKLYPGLMDKEKK
ncbi:MAG: response regulator [Cyclobacteriaceae bacterium]|nr:response regulator [Cyclobacteriaceae bacterium]